MSAFDPERRWSAQGFQQSFQQSKGSLSPMRHGLRHTSFCISKAELEDQYVIRQQYDPNNHLRNLMALRGTALQFVFLSKGFWFLCVYNTLVFVGWTMLADERREYLRTNWALKSGYISALSSLVVFTIVFYTGNCYAVYKDLFHMGCKVSQRIVMLAMHMKSVFRNKDDVWASVRHMIAAQHVFYYELKAQLAQYHAQNSVELGHPGKWEDWATDKLVGKSIIKPTEASILNEYEGKKTTLLSGWAQTSFIEHCKHNHHYNALSAPLQSQFLRVVLTENEKVQELLTSTSMTREFGVPFVYHHIVHLLVLFYLLLLSFGNLFVEDHVSYWGLITYPVQCFVMKGILAAADAMADPFGADDCDFNLDALTINCYKECAQLVDFISTDEAAMASIAVEHCDKPQLEHSRAASDASHVRHHSESFVTLPSSSALTSAVTPSPRYPSPHPWSEEISDSRSPKAPSVLPPPPALSPHSTPLQTNPVPLQPFPQEGGGAAAVRMMSLMVESVQSLAAKNQEQAEQLRGVERRMVGMMKEAMAEFEAAIHNPRAQTGGQEQRTRALGTARRFSRTLMSRAGICPEPSGMDEREGTRETVKHKEKHGIQMTARAVPSAAAAAGRPAQHPIPGRTNPHEWKGGGWASMKAVSEMWETETRTHDAEDLMSRAETCTEPSGMDEREGTRETVKHKEKHGIQMTARPMPSAAAAAGRPAETQSRTHDSQGSQPCPGDAVLSVSDDDHDDEGEPEDGVAPLH